MVGDVGHESGWTTDDEYISAGSGVCTGDERGWKREGRVGDSVNGILLGHPFTRTRRKLEDLIWRAVWIAFALAMPPIEPSVIYVHIHARYALLYTDEREYEHVRVRGVYEGAVYTKTQFAFIRSFARRAYTQRCIRYTRIRMYTFRVFVCARVPSRTCGFLHFMIYRAAFSGPQSVLKARRLIKEIIEDAK